MNAFIILGNQLFDHKHLSSYKQSHFFYIAEDKSLCSYVKHHKQKLYYFLASMREYNEELKTKGYNVYYSDIEKSIKTKSYFDNLLLFLKKNKLKSITLFEIEDKLFEKKFYNFLKINKINFRFLKSPMFLTERNEFLDITKDKKPLMASFYSYQRKKLNILIEEGKPIGGKWSFDKDNRKRIPKDYILPEIKTYKSDFYEDISIIIEKYFNDHFGDLNKNSMFPFNRKEALKSLENFIRNKLQHFGDYEDFITIDQHPINHSILSGALNIGILTPDDIINSIKKINLKKYGLNNVEGFIRQIIGWREFIRGINLKYYDEMISGNFFNHKRLMTKHWYNGTTSLPILNDLVLDLKKTGYAHHIPRLMIASNIMNLSGIKPIEVYKWFMTTFVDSSDWVMVPNVFGMGLFSDGGIFATKPYICGSNYLLKMSNYKKGPWTEILDGLYWNFIKKNESFFKKNPRLSMMTIALNRMPHSKLKTHIKNAEDFINEYTI